MLKEICITPQVFDKKYLDNTNWKDVKAVLEAIKNSGYIVGLNNDDWMKTVRQNLSVLGSNDPDEQKIIRKIKDYLNNIFDVLKNRNRICGHPKGSIVPNSEEEWINLAKSLDDIRHFSALVATSHFFANVYSVDDLEDMDIADKFGITGSKHYIKNEETFQQLFLPILSYARKLTIIDPYFYLDEERYLNTFLLMAKFFRERRGHREKGSITINCKWNTEWDGIKKPKFNKWQHEIKKIFQEYGHIVSVYIWERKTLEIKLHERYIITDQAGIVAGAGIDKDDYQQSEWSIKDYLSLDEIKSQYIESADIFKLKCIVTASTIDIR